MSRTLLCFLEYDGEGFFGWQCQPELRTVQGVFQDAVSSMVQHDVVARSTSRTDRGVHSRGLPVTFNTDKDISLYSFRRGLNSILPADIAVREVREMPFEWNVRDDVLGKTYIYRYQVGPSRSPLLNRTSYYVRRNTIDVEAMQTASQFFVGTHDFNSFRHTKCMASTTERAMEMADVSAIPDSPLVEFTIRGNAFLQHMVRIMAGTLLQVGLHQRPADAIEDILLAKDRQAAGPTLPSHGLTQHVVHFRSIAGLDV